MIERWRLLRVPATLGAGVAGLTVAASWISGIAMSVCDEVTPGPSGWVYAGLLLFAVGIAAVGVVGAIVTERSRILATAYLAIGVIEGATAVVLFFWLLGKYGHYNCG
jgi:hypothetical protein